MDGTVLNFDAESGGGVIRASDGKRYKFTATDWSSAGSPLIGDVVDFEPDEGAAMEIFVTSRIAQADPAPFVAATYETTLNTQNPLNESAQTVASAPASASSQPIQMPSGLGARFFIAYAVTLIPTYVLPYFGSNSLLVNGIASDIGGMPVQFWWHISCYAVLIFLAFIRGARISRLWLATFPVIAAIFDLLPVINNIPLVPTVFNAAALYIGASKSAPDGYVPDNLNQKIEFGLWGIAAFSAFAIYKIWTSPFSSGNGFAGSLLLWPVLGLAAFFAFKYRAGEGASIVGDLTARFNGATGSTGMSFAEEQGIVPVPQTMQPQPTSRMNEAVNASATAPNSAELDQNFCSNCGTANLPRDHFCGDCGTPLAGV
jgi:uncharacterized membrane protein (GlpM family)